VESAVKTTGGEREDERQKEKDRKQIRKKVLERDLNMSHVKYNFLRPIL